MLDNALRTLKLAQSLEDRTAEQRRNLMIALVQERRAIFRPSQIKANARLLNIEIDGIFVEATDSDQLIENWRIAALDACS